MTSMTTRQSSDGYPLARAMAVAAASGGVLSRSDAEAAGLSKAQVVTLLRRGRWTRVHRGFFVPGLPPDAAQLAGSRVLAALRHRAGDRADLTVGARWLAWQETAAQVHGLPLVHRPASRVVLLDRDLTPLLPEHVVVVNGVPVTSLARTVADLARRHGRWQGIAAADRALRLGASREDLRAAAEHGAGWRGATAARLVAEAARPKAESPLESVGRLRIIELGYPEPELQVDVTGPFGWVGRVDHLWEQPLVIAEADGLGKYRGAYEDSGERDPGDIVAQEKLREDGLRDTGAEVARYTWAMALRRPDQLDTRLRNAFARAVRHAA